MYIITDQNNRISAITSTVEKQEVDPELHAWNYLVNDGAYAVPAISVKTVFELDTSEIPPGIEPFTYCYNKENGFYLFEQQSIDIPEFEPEEEILNG